MKNHLIIDSSKNFFIFKLQTAGPVSFGDNSCVAECIAESYEEPHDPAGEVGGPGHNNGCGAEGETRAKN